MIVIRDLEQIGATGFHLESMNVILVEVREIGKVSLCRIFHDIVRSSILFSGQ